jgi:hypothetical protein
MLGNKRFEELLLTNKESVIRAESKGILQSKTFWGLVLMILSARLKDWFGIELPDESWDAMAADVGIIVGAVLGIYGRVKAGAKIDGVS